MFGSTWLKFDELLAIFVDSCPRREIPLQHSLFCAFCMSTCFVLSLYVLVPLKIRRLDRDNDIHIKRRILATATASILCSGSFPLIICSFSDNPMDQPSAMQLLGINLEITPIFLVLVHTSMLYTGATVATVLQVHKIVSLQRRQNKVCNHFDIFRKVCITPILNPFWPQIRNLFTAPILEELVFRACMVPLLRESLKDNTTTIVWITPLFFGVAHVHHAFLKWRENHPWKSILLSSIFQLSYTTLFGAYATYVFLRTNSLLTIIVSHQYCNYMGLPDLSFFQPHFGRLSLIHQHRWFLVFSYLFGFVMFIWGFHVILP